MLIVTDQTLASTAPNVHLFIVAIGQFDNADAYAPLGAAPSRITELTKFFQDNYALSQDQIHIYSNQTGNADEQSLLQLQRDITFIARSERSIVFLFVLTHGKVIDSLDFGQDLLVVASNTPGTAATGDKGRVLGSEFLKGLGSVGEHSIIFAFFDTCSSGALQLTGDRLLSYFLLKHQRVVAISSSGANQLSYDFSFTSALLKRWQDQVNGCDYANNLVNQLPLTGQNLRLISGDDQVCINGVNPTKALLFILSDNQEGVVRIHPQSGNTLKDLYVQRSDLRPLVQIMSREDVNIELYDTQGRELQRAYQTMHLAQQPLTFISLSEGPYSPQPQPDTSIFPMLSPIAPGRITK